MLIAIAVVKLLHFTRWQIVDDLWCGCGGERRPTINERTRMWRYAPRDADKAKKHQSFELHTEKRSSDVQALLRLGNIDCGDRVFQGLDLEHRNKFTITYTKLVANAVKFGRPTKT